MAKFFVGQRVRFANPQRATCPLRGGICVIEGFFQERTAWPEPLKIDCRVRFINGPAGNVHTMELEPILDRHEPCEAEFKESLDELLSREVKNETV